MPRKKTQPQRILDFQNCRSPKEIAQQFGVSVSTLCDWRVKRDLKKKSRNGLEYPRYYQNDLTGAVLYDLDEFAHDLSVIYGA